MNLISDLSGAFGIEFKVAGSTCLLTAISDTKKFETGENQQGITEHFYPSKY